MLAGNATSRNGRTFSPKSEDFVSIEYVSHKFVEQLPAALTMEIMRVLQTFHGLQGHGPFSNFEPHPCLGLNHPGYGSDTPSNLNLSVTCGFKNVLGTSSKWFYRWKVKTWPNFLAFQLSSLESPSISFTVSPLELLTHSIQNGNLWYGVQAIIFYYLITDLAPAIFLGLALCNLSYFFHKDSIKEAGQRDKAHVLFWPKI